MSSLHDSSSNVHHGNDEDWPAWTQDFTWELGPDPEDVQEASQLLNDESWDTDEPIPDDVLESKAGEALAQDLLERALRFF